MPLGLDIPKLNGKFHFGSRAETESVFELKKKKTSEICASNLYKTDDADLTDCLGAGMATATTIPLVTFDGAAGTTHKFTELNDPACGRSTGTWSEAGGVASSTAR